MKSVIYFRPLSRFTSSVASPKPYRHGPTLPNGPTYDSLPRPFWKPSRWFRGTPKTYLQAANQSTKARLKNLFQRRPLVNYSSLRGRCRLRIRFPKFLFHLTLDGLLFFLQVGFAVKSGIQNSHVGLSGRRLARGVLKWSPLPVVFGFLFIAYRRFFDVKVQDEGLQRTNSTESVGTQTRKKLPWHIPTVVREFSRFTSLKWVVDCLIV
jgi:hypothetical protein